MHSLGCAPSEVSEPPNFLTRCCLLFFSLVELTFTHTKSDKRDNNLLNLGLPPQTGNTFCLDTKSIQKSQGL